MFKACGYEICKNFKNSTRFVELPTAKIGEFAWVIRNYKGIHHAQIGKVSDMFFTSGMKLMVVVSHIARGEWGKTVFATQKEAEESIDKMKHRNSDSK